MKTEKEKNNSFVYILHCADDTLYTGYTTNVKRRLKEHQAGSRKCKYTMAKTRRPLVVKQVWEVEGSRGNALRIEAFIKKMDRKKKNKLISNPEQLSELYREKSSQNIKCWTIKEVND